MGIIIDGTTGIDLGHTPVNNGTNYEVEGNLNISGVGARITGDFSNAIISNRVAFQTSSLNSVTVVPIIPNGTGAVSGFSFLNQGNDLVNYSSMFTGFYGAEATIRASINGTGSYAPMTFYTGGTERMRIDTSGNVLVTGGGGIGYGTGSGGTVTQPPTNGKSTSVTLNKPSGQIIMNNAALAAGGKVVFIVNNNIVTAKDTVLLSTSASSDNNDAYTLSSRTLDGLFTIRVINTHNVSLSEAVVINFSVIKGAIA